MDELLLAGADEDVVLRTVGSRAELHRDGTDGQGVGTINNDDCPAAPGDVVISQVYGGGGNASAPFQSDEGGGGK